MTGTTTGAGHKKTRPHSRGRGRSRQQPTATATSILFCEGFERESGGLRFLAGPTEMSFTVARQPRNHTGFPANPPGVFSFKVRTSRDAPGSLRLSAASRKRTCPVPSPLSRTTGRAAAHLRPERSVRRCCAGRAETNNHSELIVRGDGYADAVWVGKSGSASGVPALEGELWHAVVGGGRLIPRKRPEAPTADGPVYPPQPRVRVLARCSGACLLSPRSAHGTRQDPGNGG